MKKSDLTLSDLQVIYSSADGSTPATATTSTSYNLLSSQSSSSSASASVLTSSDVAATVSAVSSSFSSSSSTSSLVITDGSVTLKDMSLINIFISDNDSLIKHAFSTRVSEVITQFSSISPNIFNLSTRPGGVEILKSFLSHHADGLLSNPDTKWMFLHDLFNLPTKGASGTEILKSFLSHHADGLLSNPDTRGIFLDYLFNLPTKGAYGIEILRNLWPGIDAAMESDFLIKEEISSYLIRAVVKNPTKYNALKTIIKPILERDHLATDTQLWVSSSSKSELAVFEEAMGYVATDNSSPLIGTDRRGVHPTINRILRNTYTDISDFATREILTTTLIDGLTIAINNEDIITILTVAAGRNSLCLYKNKQEDSGGSSAGAYLDLLGKKGVIIINGITDCLMKENVLAIAPVTSFIVHEYTHRFADLLFYNQCNPFLKNAMASSSSSLSSSSLASSSSSSSLSSSGFTGIKDEIIGSLISIKNVLELHQMDVDISNVSDLDVFDLIKVLKDLLNECTDSIWPSACNVILSYIIQPIDHELVSSIGKKYTAEDIIGTDLSLIGYEPESHSAEIPAFLIERMALKAFEDHARTTNIFGNKLLLQHHPLKNYMNKVVLVAKKYIEREALVKGYLPFLEDDGIANMIMVYSRDDSEFIEMGWGVVDLVGSL